MVKSLFSRWTGFVGKLFLDGLITLLPLMVTYTIFSVSFHIIKSWLAPLRRCQDFIPFFRQIPHAEVILAITLIILAGIFLKSFIMRSLLQILDWIMHHVPFVGAVYGAIKKLVAAFSPDKNSPQQKVVLVEFPRAGLYSIGFQTGEFEGNWLGKPQERLYSIIIPTTPNPTTGYLVIAKQSDLIHLTITPQEAMALIMSGGIVQPGGQDRTK